MLLVKFIGVSPKKDISDHHDYVKRICRELEVSGLVTQLAVDPSADGESDIARNSTVTETRENEYSYRFIYARDGAASVFEIAFEFGTYHSALQLKISISSDNYDLSPDNKYLERLKFTLKDGIKDDWEQLVWLLDKDSEVLAKELYPRLFQAENLLRQVINELMIKRYGINWWDEYVPIEIKRKHSARMAGYKTVAPGFANIDERLLSIDIGDLKEILTMRREKWSPKLNDSLNAMLTHRAEWKDASVRDILEKQLVVETDLWDQQFSWYLPADFPDKLRIFDLNRNHIAHDKLIDRVAYHSIRQSIEATSTDLEIALEKIDQDLISSEEESALREAMMAADAEADEEDRFEELMETEANVEIRHDEEIVDMFDEAVQTVHTFLTDNLRFRDDIEFTSTESIDGKTLRGKLFTIEYKIEDESVDVAYELEINDGQGETSTLTVSVAGEQGGSNFEFWLEYVNGEAVFDDELCYYYPATQDEIVNLDEFENALLSYIENRFKNWRADVDVGEYERVKDGAEPLVADIPCWNCGECYICVNEDYNEYGKCLNCGEHNDIVRCARCESFCEGDPDSAEPQFCDNCLDIMENE